MHADVLSRRLHSGATVPQEPEDIMSKLYHITTDGIQQDIIASNIAVAVRRALERKESRSARHLTIEAHISNHGEYDKCSYVCFDDEGKPVFSALNDAGTYLRLPAMVRRAEAAERMGIEAQRVLDACKGIAHVVCATRGSVVTEATRAGVVLDADAQARIASRVRFQRMV